MPSSFQGKPQRAHILHRRKLWPSAFQQMQETGMCWMFVLDPCFVMEYLVSFLVLQSSRWGRDSCGYDTFIVCLLSYGCLGWFVVSRFLVILHFWLFWGGGLILYVSTTFGCCFCPSLEVMSPCFFKSYYSSKNFSVFRNNGKVFPALMIRTRFWSGPRRFGIHRVETVVSGSTITIIA